MLDAPRLPPVLEARRFCKRVMHQPSPGAQRAALAHIYMRAGLERAGR